MVWGLEIIFALHFFPLISIPKLNVFNNPLLYEEEASEEEGEDPGPKTSKKLRKMHERPLPPLLSRVNGNLEVYGFSSRARKAFLNMIMRWGLPPQEMNYDNRWYVRELRSKNDKEFNAYLSLFCRHLCEPENNTPNYADTLPKEGMQRTLVLYRIGIMHLIRKKVKEFEAINGVWSEPSKMPGPEEFKEFMANSYSYKKSVDQMKKKEEGAEHENGENGEKEEKDNEKSEKSEDEKKQEVIEIEEDDKEKQYEDPDLNADHRLKIWVGDFFFLQKKEERRNSRFFFHIQQMPAKIFSKIYK